jgi:hypothetical protein
VFSATGSGSGKNKIDVLSFKQPKSKLFVTVKIVLGIVGSFTIEYEPVIYLHVERLYLYIKRIYSMYCYAVYCTSVCVNRYMKVQMMLTHAHNIPCPPGTQPIGAGKQKQSMCTHSTHKVLYTYSSCRRLEERACILVLTCMCVVSL